MIERSKLQTLDTLVDKIVFAQEKDRYLKAHNASVSNIMANANEKVHWQDELSANSTKEELQILFKKYVLQFMKHPYLNSILQQKMQAVNLDSQSILNILHQICSNQPVNQMLLKMCAYGQVGSFLFPGQKNELFFNQSSSYDLTQDLPNILADFSNKKISSTLRNRVGCDLYARCIPLLWDGVSSLAFSQSSEKIKQLLTLKETTGAPLFSLLSSTQIISLLKGRTLNEKKEILSSCRSSDESITLGKALTDILNQPLQILIGSEGVSFIKDCFTQRNKVQAQLKSLTKNPLQTATRAHQLLKQFWQQSKSDHS